jgi:hypothetical protein
MATLTCSRCSTEFHGRADAVHCSTNCRQRAHRDRRRRTKVADPKRLRLALNIINYDALISVAELRDEVGGAHSSEWADWFDDCIEWLSVARDGLRGMTPDECGQASVDRGLKLGGATRDVGRRGPEAALHAMGTDILASSGVGSKRNLGAPIGYSP